MLEALGPWLQLATRVGEMSAQLVPANPDRVEVAYTGTISGRDLRPITHHLLSGFLRHSSAEPVNAVNAPFLARERGIRLSQTSTAEDDDYVATIGVNASGPGGGVNVVGTVSGKHSLRIVRVDDFKLDAVPEGNLLVLWNEDVPKIVGRIGSILGDAEINIGRIHLSRSAPRGQAFSIFSLDSKVPDGVLERLRAIPKMQRVRQFHL
jgi:D-3-phosphoglycerate dehydrogenase/(S)-sulfolactate dehydrogenase